MMHVKKKTKKNRRNVLLLLCVTTVVLDVNVVEAWSPPSSSLLNAATVTKLFEDDNRGETKATKTTTLTTLNRRDALIKTFSFPAAALSFAPSLLSLPQASYAEEEIATATAKVSVTGEVKKLFNEGRAFELQGNIAAAQRVYAKVTRLEPTFVYGWSNLGNAQVALGSLVPAEQSYDNAITLCNENLSQTEAGFGIKRCNDEYLLLLNRGCLRMNSLGAATEKEDISKRKRDALRDLQISNSLVGKPDAIVLQNLARAEEMNGLYRQADRNYNTAISMTSNEVSPFWLKSANVKYQVGDVQGGYDLLKRVENKFPEAPEVRAAYATFLSQKGDMVSAQKKYLEIPALQRMQYKDNDYLTNTINWPPAMIESLSKIIIAVGD